MWSLANKAYTKSYTGELFGASNIFCFVVYVLVFALPFVLGSFQKCKISEVSFDDVRRLTLRSMEDQLVCDRHPEDHFQTQVLPHSDSGGRHEKIFFQSQRFQLPARFETTARGDGLRRRERRPGQRRGQRLAQRRLLDLRTLGRKTGAQPLPHLLLPK